jgi:ArsR family transcriptional regulator, arsenate/arsenite/antimonite-responsive transcriptional repressor
MPVFEDDGGPAEPSVEVRPSAVLELSWLIYMPSSPHKREGARGSAAAVAAAADDIQAELRDIWGDEADADCLPEISILAHRSGTLLADEADSFLDGLDRAARIGEPRPELLSETPEVREATWRRLERMRRDPALVRHYRAVLAHVWDMVRDEWEETGQRVVRRACRQWSDQIARGTPPTELLPEKRLFRSPELPRLIGLRGSLVLSPLYFCSPRGGIVIDTNDYVHVGGPLQSVDGERLLREESDQLAARLKVLADGTRVGLLRQLAEEPATVMDLARRFGLAQPTVSNHVRLLRDAGLLDSRRDGARVLYRVAPDRLERLLSETRQVLLER